MISRRNVEFAKHIFFHSVGAEYIYGGGVDTDRDDGADCSGLVTAILSALLGGADHMIWGRRGLSTESYRYKPYGPQNVGPFPLVHVRSLADIPPDAVAIINLHHEGAGGPQSHMNIQLDGILMEESGSYGWCTSPRAIPTDSGYWNDHWYVPGPIVEGGTSHTDPAEPSDTLYADVSEWQSPVDDSYPYKVLCIRSNDGTYRDKKWATNYEWCKRAADDGRLAFFIVYFVWRPNWQAAVDTLQYQVGEPHPKMAVMLDVESWGDRISGNQSAGINGAFERIAEWLGDCRRVIGYGNVGDLNELWPQKPEGVRLVVAGYGNNPSYPGKIAHQYTDGQGYGGGLPEGAPPFGNCDMNSADGLSPSQFAATLGIQTGDQLTQEEHDKLFQIWGALFNPIGSKSKYKAEGEGDVYTTKDLIPNIDAMTHEALIERNALLGNPDAIALVKRQADKGDKWAQIVFEKCPKEATNG